MEEEKKGQGFVIKDRRMFDEKGEARQAEEGPRPPREETKQSGPAEEAEKRAEARRSMDEQLPPVTFSDFIVSLSTSAIFHFGEIPDPVTKKAEKNLLAAKQMIDILGVLEQKTRGNLDENEKKLLDAILYELRMRFVKEAGK